MVNLRILYTNLHLILLKEISKLKEYIKELKISYNNQDKKLNDIIEKATNMLQGYQLIESEINSIEKKKVITKGEKITAAILNKIFQIKNPSDQIISIMKILYDILKLNIDKIEDNLEEESNWDFIKKKLDKKSIFLLLSFISETSDLNISKEIMDNVTPIITKYDQYKTTYIKTFPEILLIIDFIQALIVYYTKLTMLKKLYFSNQKKSNKMKIIQSDMTKYAELIKLTEFFLDKILKDYENYNTLLKKKDENNRMIIGYNILEKYSLYEKYIVSEEYISKNDEYNNSEYYNNLKKTKKYIIKFDRKYNHKEKFIQQLSSSLNTYSKGIRKINREKFIKAINTNRNNNTSSKNNSNSNNISKSRNKNNISINFSTNNILMGSTESNNSSMNLGASFHTNITNSILNPPRINNSSPFRNDNSRNTNSNSILYKGSFVGSSYPNFDNIFQMSSSRNTNIKEGLNISSIDCDQSQTKFTNKTILNAHEINSVKSNKNKEKKRNKENIRNKKEKQINLKLENEQQYSFCSICCKDVKIDEICPK